MSNVFTIVPSLLLSLLASSLVSTVHGAEQYLEVDLSTQMPADNCSSLKEPGGNSLKVAPRYGPCSPLGGSTAKLVDLRKLLYRDQLRVHFLFQTLLLNSSNHDQVQLPGSQVSIPARRGLALDTANYIITIGLGTPSRHQTVVFDTGSTLSWVQCKPCSSCYRQKEPIFNPAASSTYRNLSCTSAACSLVDSLGCSSGACLYGIIYGDGSSSVGSVSQDTLTFATSSVFRGFVFGCGQANEGLFGREAGIFGLSRGPLSLVSQASSKYGRVFSYCLPSLTSSTGDLTLGPVTSTVQYTPMLTDSRNPALYFLRMTAISVGGRLLPISTTVFAKAGTIIDSGTVITRLPKTAYEALRAAFRNGMARYKLGRPLSILDTCYNFTGLRRVSVPKVALHFRGGVRVKLSYRATMFIASTSQTCLAFTGNEDDARVGVIGNTQQASLRVVYDLAKLRIGFGRGSCR